MQRFTARNGWLAAQHKFRFMKEHIVAIRPLEHVQIDAVHINLGLTDQEGNFKSVKPKSFWLGSEFSTESGTLEYKKLFKSKAFENPKPVGLILNCLYQSISGSNEYILDFFSGSGTTGQSVFEYNNKSNKNTKFILIQLPVDINEKHDAFKKGYKTISQILINRLKLSNKEYNYNQGFKVFKQENSTIYKWQDFLPDQDGILPDLFNNLEMAYKNPLQDGVTTQDFITEVLLQEGFPLTAKQEEVVSGIFKISHEWVPYTLYITMLYSFKDTDFNKLQLQETDHFVCLDKAFEGNDALKQELDNQTVIPFKIIAMSLGNNTEYREGHGKANAMLSGLKSRTIDSANTTVKRQVKNLETNKIEMQDTGVSIFQYLTDVYNNDLLKDGQSGKVNSLVFKKFLENIPPTIMYGDQSLKSVIAQAHESSFFKL